MPKKKSEILKMDMDVLKVKADRFDENLPFTAKMTASYKEAKLLQQAMFDLMGLMLDEIRGGENGS